MKSQLGKDELAGYYPRLYHMADRGSWPSIKQHGLLSTSALLDLFKITGKKRATIESAHRPDCVCLQDPEMGSALIRDQKPMRESALLLCLSGCTPIEWYRFLNRHVFFWVSEERVNTLLNARAYRSQEHLVLTLDTMALLRSHWDSVLLSPINSGSTIYRPVRRDLTTFARPSNYPFTERKKLRGIANAVAELTVEYAVPDITNFTVLVEVRKGGERVKTLWAR